MNFLLFLKKNAFLLGLLLAFLAVDAAAASWNPMVTSLRFQKNDFTKTLMHHGWQDTGRVFFGNSSVTGAYMEDKSQYPLVEMGLSYGKITDLQQILQHPWYHVQGQLVIGIDVHTMLDKLDTDPTYQWHKKPYQPYLYAYRDYFKDSGTIFAKQVYKGLIDRNPQEMLAYEPKWSDKELYYGQNSVADLKKDWARYDKLFNWMRMPDFRDNLAALDWVLQYADRNKLDLKVVWMPYNPGFTHPPYMDELKAAVDAKLQAHQVPVLDLMDKYAPKYFHDIVHLNREEGAPLFTKEVDAWLESFAKPSKS